MAAPGGSLSTISEIVGVDNTVSSPEAPTRVRSRFERMSSAAIRAMVTRRFEGTLTLGFISDQRGEAAPGAGPSSAAGLSDCAMVSKTDSYLRNELASGAMQVTR